MEISSLEIKEYRFNKISPRWELFITFNLFINHKEIFCSAFLEFDNNGWNIDVRELQKINFVPIHLKKSILSHEKILSFKECIIDKNEKEASRPIISDVKEKLRHENIVMCYFTLKRGEKEERIRSLLEKIDGDWFISCYFKDNLPHYYQIEKDFLSFDEYVFSEIKKDKKMRIRFLF